MAGVGGHVFISYARDDRAYAARLAAHLGDHGLKVWYDDAIAPGSRWAEMIEHRIVDCVAMLVVVTDHSRASDWVAREINLAEKKQKLVVPLLLSGPVWLRLNDIQHIDVRDGGLPDPELLQRVLAPGAETEESSHTSRRPQRRAPIRATRNFAGIRSLFSSANWRTGLILTVTGSAGVAAAVVAILSTSEDHGSPGPEGPSTPVAVAPATPRDLGEIKAGGDTCVEARNFDRRAEGSISMSGCNGQPNQHLVAIKSGVPAAYKLKFINEDRCLVALNEDVVGTDICDSAKSWEFERSDFSHSDRSSWGIRYTDAKGQRCLTLPSDAPEPRRLTMTECGEISNTQQWWVNHPASWFDQ